MTLAVCLTALLTLAIGVRAAMGVLRDMAPQVGTLIRFTPGSPSPLVPVRVTAHRLATTARAGGTCTLSAQTMTADGGSLMVEARNRRTREALVNWAGGRTARGPGDCGRTAALRIDTESLRALAEAAGGLGPESTDALAGNAGGA
jgi:hypothetical protein